MNKGKIRQFSPAYIFHQMRRGEKPLLKKTGRHHTAIRKTLERMHEAGFIESAPKYYYRDFAVTPKLSPEQLTRLESDTSIQPFTDAMAQMQTEVEAALKGVATPYNLTGRNAFLRNERARYHVTSTLPTIIAPGNMYDAECLYRALYRRNKNSDIPLIIYNPSGFWDDLLNLIPANKKDGPHVHICQNAHELKTALQSYENIAFMPHKTNPNQINTFTIPERPHLANISNNAEKRSHTAALIVEQNAAFRVHYIGDLTGHLPNSEEVTATGAGNGGAKGLDGIYLYQGMRHRLRMEGHDPKKTFGFASDIVMECSDPRITDHPLIQKNYGHVIKPGHVFPGSEMADVEKSTNMAQVMADIHTAYDDLGVPESDRKITIQTVNYLMPLDQRLPANATIKDAKHVVVSGRQTYLLRRKPFPDNKYGNDLFNYITLPSEPESSQRAYLAEHGKIHPENHLSRAWRALEHVIEVPKRPISNPYVAKPKIANPAEIVTSAHYTGEWSGTPSDHFTKAALQGFEARGYRFADKWEGGQGLLALEKFRRNRDGFVILPRNYHNANDEMATLNAKMHHLDFVISHEVDRALADPYVRGRALVTYDHDVVNMFATSYKTGLNSVAPDKSAVIVQDVNTPLADMLDKGYMRHEFHNDPHIPDWEEELSLPDFQKDNVVALLGSAKTRNPRQLANSFELAKQHHLADWALSDGFGGEGDMGEFAKASAQLANQGYTNLERWGVTTPLTAIEKEPMALRTTYLSENNASARDIYRRMYHGIFREGVNAANSRPGGTGTLQEIQIFSHMILDGRDAINVISGETINVAGTPMKPFGGYLSLFNQWELGKMNLREAGSVDEMLEITRDFAAQKKRPSLRA